MGQLPKLGNHNPDFRLREKIEKDHRFYSRPIITYSQDPSFCLDL